MTRNERQGEVEPVRQQVLAQLGVGAVQELPLRLWVGNGEARERAGDARARRAEI